jgi:DNA-binding NarL/FixJ family response regulator
MIEPARSDTASDLRFALAQRGLTPRESEVARALLLGRTNIEIAGDLRLSPNTVHDHVRNVFDKLAVSSRQQLALQLLA